MKWYDKVKILCVGNNDYFYRYGLEILGKIRRLRKFEHKSHRDIAKEVNLTPQISIRICMKYKWIPNYIKGENAQGWLKGRTYSRKPINEIKYAHRLKIRLIKDGIRKPECEFCNWKYLEHPWWQNIVNKDNCPLEIHHKDGNKRNNTLINVELLCPNCHSLTPNYRYRKRA